MYPQVQLVHSFWKTWLMGYRRDKGISELIHKTVMNYQQA